MEASKRNAPFSLKEWAVRAMRSQYFRLVVILGIELVFFTLFAPYFARPRNIQNILRQVAEIGMMAVPLTLLLISGHMDLSVGSILGLCGVITGMMMRDGLPIPLALLAGMAAGVLVGLLNGYLIGVLKIQGVVVTIGTQVMIRGLCYIITQGRAVSGYPQKFFAINQQVLGLSPSVLVWLGLSLLTIVILEKSYIGRSIQAIGNNQNTALYSGVRVTRYKVLLFAFCGLITAVASIFLIGRISSAEATLGAGYELDVITAALLGGVSIMGGKGKLQGAMLGIIIIGVLRNGLNMMGMSVIYQSIILGVLLLIAVVERR
ncbi:MAG: ABC transporter permease [Candidatus Limiplasma sp.]|nr:ABC transporter permease [Candidatus Limiplasma sp.]